MERKLYKFIMNPAMMVSWVFGLILVFMVVQSAGELWIWFKGICVISMTIFHVWLGRQRKQLAAGNIPLSGRSYRMMNEVPTLLMLVIVASVVFKF